MLHLGDAQGKSLWVLFTELNLRQQEKVWCLPVAIQALEPQASSVGLQIPSELRISQSLELESLNPKHVALQVCACCSYEHAIKSSQWGWVRKQRVVTPLFSHSSYFSLISISAPRSSRFGSGMLWLGLREVASPSRESLSASLHVRASWFVELCRVCAEEERPLKDSPGGWKAFSQHLKAVVLLKTLGQNTAVKVMFRWDLAAVVSDFQGMYNPLISTLFAMRLDYG